MNIKKITVVGLGYVGLAQALLFNDAFNVVGYDTNKDVVENLRKGILHIKDAEFSEALARKKLNTTGDPNFAFKDADIVIIATPTHFNETSKTFDLSSIDETLAKIKKSKINPIVIIKSPVNVGATKYFQSKYPALNIFFVPEFLREGHALFDNYYPSRIVVGYAQDNAKDAQIAGEIAELFKNHAKNRDDLPL